MDFQVGDRVEIVCKDGKRFAGVLLDFTEAYFILSPGLGFPHDEIIVMNRV
jgi:hypothetical protein